MSTDCRVVTLVAWIILIGWCSVGWAQIPCEATEMAKLRAGDDDSGDVFGEAVAMSGNYAVVGAWGDNEGGASAGAAYVFGRDGHTWTQLDKLVAGDASPGDHFGFAVAVAPDRRVVVGAWLDDEVGFHAGSAYIFRHEDGAWVEEAKLLPADLVAEDMFGYSVAIDGNLAIVGSLRDEPGGSAYVYRRDGTTWVLEAKLTPDDLAAGDWFGVSVAIHEGRALIGASGSGLNGAAYVFRRDGLAWSQYARLAASDGSPVDQFGKDVDLDNEVAIVGAAFSNDAGDDSGSAYVFRLLDGFWTEEAKLTASDAAPNDRFGRSVGIDGDVALVGALLNDERDTDAGAVYAFHRFDDGWIEGAKLTPADGSAHDHFGVDLAVSGDFGIMGAHFDDDGGLSSGSAYVCRGLSDCNQNATLDLCDIIDGTSADSNGNGIPDECNDVPIALCQPVTVVAGSDCQAIVPPHVVDNGSYDPAGGPVTLYVEPPGPFPVGSTLVTLTVIDQDGDYAMCSAEIEVIDIDPPEIMCPPHMVSPCTEQEVGQYVDFELPMASDNCGQLGLMVYCEPASGSFFPLGTTQVMCVAIDTSGNQAVCSFSVVVEDNTPPEVVACESVVLEADANCSASMPELCLDVGFWDECEPEVTCTQDPAPGTLFMSVGTYPAVVFGIDSSGNAAFCQLMVEVVDHDVYIWCPPEATVNCPDEIDPMFTGQPTASSACTGWQVSYTDSGSCPLITRVWTVVNESGWTESCTQQILISDGEPPLVVECPDDVSMAADLASCTAAVTWPLPVWEEDCSGATVAFHIDLDDDGSDDATIQEPTFVFPVGVHRVTVSTVDECGNSDASCSFAVTITAPAADSDGDGTPDCDDGCPDDPDKTEPGVCGCGAADSDGDGIPDCLDPPGVAIVTEPDPYALDGETLLATLPGYGGEQVYNIYAEFDEPDDQCIAVFGSLEMPFQIRTSDGSGFLNATTVGTRDRPLAQFFLDFVPEYNYDSFYTIGNRILDVGPDWDDGSPFSDELSVLPPDFDGPNRDPWPAEPHTSMIWWVSPTTESPLGNTLRPPQSIAANWPGHRVLLMRLVVDPCASVEGTFGLTYNDASSGEIVGVYVAVPSGPDCNGNQLPDACDIALGTSTDANANGLPDECEGDGQSTTIEDVDQGETAQIDPGGGGSLDPTQGPLVQLTNVSGPDDASVAVTASETDLHPGAGGYAVFDTQVTISTSLADGQFFMRVSIPFDADDLAGADPLAVDLTFYDPDLSRWVPAAQANTVASPGHEGPLGDRFVVASTTVPELSEDLGDYGVYWNAVEERGFAWANVDHTTDFAAGLPACPGDTDGNGVVDVQDLVNVILDWGGDGAAHHGDVDGNGIVDVNDLTSVILTWGACP